MAKRFLGSTDGLVGEKCIAIAVTRRHGRTVVAASMVGVEEAVDVETLLRQELEPNPELVQGQLENGLKYVILPNKVPPNRFEAHLEIHAGSVDEREHEQGVAHLVEHVTFLGSKKREGLLGTGSRSNAYTDFHHTVFHVHSPNTNGITGQPMLYQVLDALVEIAFEAQFLPSRIEKERRAVTAEAQMMNTIEYRVDCQMLRYLHHDNDLGCRFPIGQTDQVEQWSPELLKDFWQRFYFPANATLYVVGDLERGVEGTEAVIRDTFGRIPARTLPALPPADTAPAADTEAPAQALLKQRDAVRPPVQHTFGVALESQQAGAAKVEVFRHRLLQHFMLSVFCKLPVQTITTLADLRHAFMGRVVLSVFAFRVNARYVDADSPRFHSIELDYSDSGREGCTVSTLTITSEPRDWRGAITVAVEEVRRLQKYGVTRGELERYQAALLRDSQQLAGQAGSVPSADNLDFVMESLALGHIITDQRDGHKALQAVADSITLDEVNAIAASILSFASHYGKEKELVADAKARPDKWGPPGPTRATALVACIPMYTDTSGNSTGAAKPVHRGASLTTSEHIDPSAARVSLEDDGAEDVPEGAVRFELEASEIEAALVAESVEVDAPADIVVPTSLISEAELAERMEEQRPRFVALDGSDAEPGSSTAQAAAGDETGIVQLRLSNGVRVNLRHTDNEPQSAMLRMIATGGKAREGEGAGPTGNGVVAVGTRTLSESGTVGTWEREQVELFCISKLINCVLEADMEFIVMDFHFAVGDQGLKSVLELLNLFVSAPRWNPQAMVRAKQAFTTHFRAMPKSLERATADRQLSAMFGSDRRFRDASPEEIEALSLEAMETAVMAQLHAGNIELSIVGDIDLEEAQQLVLKYAGTIPPVDVPAEPERPVVLQNPLGSGRHQVWHLKDSDERACAYIAGAAPARWQGFGDVPLIQPGEAVITPYTPPLTATTEAVAEADRIRRSHPLYASVTLALLTEVINSGLFTTVRDALGLTYDVSFELNLFDRLGRGWFHVNVTSTPQKIHEALAASLRVLRGLNVQPLAQRELLRARRTLLTRHESDLKDNTYWLGLLTHLQSDSVPLKSRDCLRDLRACYEAATLQDVVDCYNQFSFADDSVYTVVGTSGREPPVAGTPQVSAGIAHSQHPPRPHLQPIAAQASAGNAQAATNGGASTDPIKPQDASAMLAALAAAAQRINLAQAMKSIGEQHMRNGDQNKS